MAPTQVLRGVATVTVFAVDHAAAQRWYTEFLGMEPYFVRPGYCEFRLGDYQHELGIIDRRFVPYFDAAVGPTGAVVYWHVDNVQATLDRLLALGARQLDAPQDRGQGFVTATVVDPFGNILGIMYNPHYMAVLGSTQTA